MVHREFHWDHGKTFGIILRCFAVEITVTTNLCGRQTVFVIESVILLHGIILLM